MNRRQTLKQLFVATGGLVALPSWAREWTPRDLPTYSSIFSVAGQQTLAAVADTIIPGGNSIGALSVGVDRFLDRLLANCYEPAVQENVKSQLAALDTAAKGSFSKIFSECTQAQRQEMLLKFSSSAIQNEIDFFTLMKSETIRGFTTSKEVMSKHLGYKVAPGHYYGCVDVKS